MKTNIARRKMETEINPANKYGPQIKKGMEKGNTKGKRILNEQVMTSKAKSRGLVTCIKDEYALL